MKQPLLVIMLMVLVLWSSAASCHNINTEDNTANNNNDDNMTSNKMNIKVGSKIFTATLLDNNSAKTFKEMLPITISMIELNGNEKYYDLSKNLPANSSNPGTIKNGDLMLYGSKTLVLFYKTFSTSYSYTKLGRIDDTAGLAVALGTGNVTVTLNWNKESLKL
jgi:hypothetical protein